jgi:hypothetical protein
MSWTFSGVAQSFFWPRLDLDVDETRATSTGMRRTVASSARVVKMHTMVTDAARSVGFWYRKTKMEAMARRIAMATA